MLERWWSLVQEGGLIFSLTKHKTFQTLFHLGPKMRDSQRKISNPILVRLIKWFSRSIYPSTTLCFYSKIILQTTTVDTMWHGRDGTLVRWLSVLHDRFAFLAHESLGVFLTSFFCSGIFEIFWCSNSKEFVDLSPKFLGFFWLLAGQMVSSF